MVTLVGYDVLLLSLEILGFALDLLTEQSKYTNFKSFLFLEYRFLPDRPFCSFQQCFLNHFIVIAGQIFAEGCL